ncbi:ATP-binding protein [[Actinomadura] parvosata]|uniref:ATP-binding protein n=1 Tax=[Actinomadura] parvosata TaxID=1955412 RepID=UPI00406C083F
MLIGRAEERAAIDGLLADVRGGRSGVLLLRGEEGIGKTALLSYAEARAGEQFLVLRGAGFEAEAELPYAGLHLLLRNSIDAIAALPGEQARVLHGALGLEQGQAGSRFLVGVAVLNLLSSLARRHRLLCLVDDAHWLDALSAEALLFAARRLGAGSIAMIFAASGDVCAFPAAGLPELHLTGLDTAAAAELLAEHAARLSPRLRGYLLQEAQGNPLALIELSAMLTAEQRAGDMPIYAVGAAPGVAPSRACLAFHDRLAVLPPKTRTLLLVAAAYDVRALDVVLQAAGKLGAGVEDLGPAECAGVICSWDGTIAFRHPLMRAAAYQSASTAQRMAAHRALAEVLRQRQDAYRWAWHLAAAQLGPDEEIAAALESSAEHARGRGGFPALAAAFERAARLSPAPADRARRLAVAAAAAADAGQYERAIALVEEAAPEAEDPVALAHLARTRAMAAMAHGHPETAQSLLAGAADAVIGQRRDVAIRLYLEALTPTGMSSDYAGLAERAARASHASLSTETPSLARALAGAGRLAAEEPPAGLSWLGDLIEGLRDNAYPLDLQERAQLAIWDLVIGDDVASYERAAAIERECRLQEAVGLLPLALTLLARSQMFLGLHRDALSSAKEGLRIARESGQRYQAGLLTGIMTYVAALEGDEARCLGLAEEIATVQDAATRNMRWVALNLLDLALGRPDRALRRAEEFVIGPAVRTVMVMHRMPDLVEAALQVGREDFARAAGERVRVWAAHTAQPWAEALALRCQALLAPEEEVERLYQRALRSHLRGGRLFERGRTELLYGAWLRRARRRSDARAHLQPAAEIFDRLGSRPWAERAHAELRAAGERRIWRQPGSGAQDRLTSQELQIVRMAGSGMSNREIAARLFLSPRTVGYHLYKAYPKLGVASRAELSRLDLDEQG